MTADSVARVALTSHLVSSSHVNELQRRIAANPHADEVDLIGEVARLSEAQIEKLRVEVIRRRAARSFAPEQGEFVLEDKICLPTRACDVDVRAVVYHGIRMHMSDARLSNELRLLGSTYFVLEHDASAELHKFGFCDGEWPLLAALRDGVSMPELEARHRDIDPRTMQAAIYALVACGSAQVLSPPRTTSPTWETKTPAPLPRTRTPSNLPAVSRTPTPGSVSYPVVPRTQTPSSSPVVMAAGTSPDAGRAQTPSTSPVVARTHTPSSPAISRTPTPRRPVARMPTAPPAFARSMSREEVAVGRTKTNPELAAEAAERANRALASDKPEAAVLELKKAVELVPNDVDYNALLGWALFCAADDKVAIAVESRKLLEKALHKSQQPEVARFYLGRVERILGRDKEALRHFHAVLDTQPNHRDASAEVRVLEARLKRLSNNSN